MAQFDGIKTEITRLLSDKRPVEGWPAKTAAIRALESDIYRYIDLHGWPSSADKYSIHKDTAEVYANLERQILDWSRVDTKLKAGLVQQ